MAAAEKSRPTTSAPRCASVSIRPEMALQVGEALAFHRRQLRLLDGVQLTASGPQLGEIVAARANVDADTLVPAGTIGAIPLGFGHGETLCSGGRLGKPLPSDSR
jgi:hypothetical protein